MCLGEFATVRSVRGDRASVEFDDGRRQVVSLAVMVAEGQDVRVGDIVLVAIGMVLRIVTADDLADELAEEPA